MFLQSRLISLAVLVITIACVTSQTSAPPMTDTKEGGKPASNPNPSDSDHATSPGSHAGHTDEMGGQGSAPQGAQEPPAWLQCMAKAAGENPDSNNIKGVFESWCSNYESVIQCLTTDLPARAESNPFDFFISLGFEPDNLRDASKEYCGKLEAESAQLACSSKQNETLATVCGHAFTQGIFHIFGLFKEKNAPADVLSQIACDVTLQTTFCLRQSLTECPPQAQATLLNYYALYTNSSCVAGEDYLPPNPQPKRPNTVVVKCADEAAQTLTPDQSRAEPASVVDFVTLGLRSDCQTYRARFDCYDRELKNITNFLDFWLSLTFDHENAIASQKAYCDQIDEVIVPQLSSECFNQSQPALTACEAGFGQEVEAIRQEWMQNADLTGVQLQTLACKTSVTRATCLGDAMKPCGETVARAMAVSEMGILPNVCRQLLAPSRDQTSREDSNSLPGSHPMGEHSGSHGSGADDKMAGGKDMGEKPLGDMGYTSDNGHNKMDDGMEMGKEENSASKKDMDDDKNGGIETTYANNLSICLSLVYLIAMYVL